MQNDVEKYRIQEYYIFIAQNVFNFDAMFRESKADYGSYLQHHYSAANPIVR